MYSDLKNMYISNTDYISEFEMMEIMSFIKKTDKFHLFYENLTINDEEKYQIQYIINERKKGKPLAYILKEKFFYGLKFYINESCLIPRWDSESLVFFAIKYLKDLAINKDKISLLDICCGCGCLGISAILSALDKEKIEQVELFFVDKDLNVLEATNKNLRKFGLNHQSKFYEYDIFNENFAKNIFKQSKMYDIILCNPPYIKTEDLNTLDLEVKNFEPYLALDGGKTGTIFYERLIHLYKKNNLSCKIIFEIGYNQKKDLIEILEKYEIKNYIFAKDIATRDRVLIIN